LESLLTVKAIDGLDPYKRKSDYNKDLSALALGNGVSGLLGGLPMISEVARSSANVNNGGRTRWSNFFHGLFLLIAMLLLIPIIEMIPSAALAAMLIAVAYRLASPKEFIGTYKVGPEQLVIFIVTILVTVGEDLLLGVGAGILTKLIFHVVNGAPISSLFKAQYNLTETTNGYDIKVNGSAIFSNFLGYKKLWASLKPGKQITFDFADSKLVDHSFMEQLHHFEEDYHLTGGHVTLVGLEKFNPFSTHPLAARKISVNGVAKSDLKLSSRQTDLSSFAKSQGYTFAPQRIKSAAKYRGFPIEKGNKILYEENLLTRNMKFGKIEISDITLVEGARQEKTETHITMAQVSDTNLSIPDFALEPEGLWSQLFEGVAGKDIDFAAYPIFSKKYYLRGENETVMASLFTESLIRFLESHEEMHAECHNQRLIFYQKKDILSVDETESLEKFAEGFMQHATSKPKPII
jgi:hypothetical protein